MKVSIFIILLTIIKSTVGRRNPFTAIKRARQLKFLMDVKDGTFLDGVDSLDPKVDFASSTQVGGVDIDYGVKAALSIKEGSERTVWAKTMVDKDDNGWKLAAKAEMDVNKRSSADLELDLLNEDIDTSVGFDARISRDGGLEAQYLELETTRETNISYFSGILQIKPRYNFADNKGDVVVNYSSDTTSLEVVASRDEREVKLSRKLFGGAVPFLKDAKYSVVASDKQDLRFEYDRQIDGVGSVTASFRPNDFAEVQYKDNGWIASYTAKLNGMTPVEPEVRIKKGVSFE